MKSGPITLQKDTGAKPIEDHDFDGIRLVMANLPRQFVDVPVLSMHDNYIGDKDWAMATRSDEPASAFALSYTMRDMLQR